MCGIGGILRTDGGPIPEEWLDIIDAGIAWRGPDGAGRFRDRVEIEDVAAPGGRRMVEVALVHRRLSIIDHAGGAQPMVSERGRHDGEGLVAVVFNGCIYNHRELRAELEGKGHRFVTDHSDTEVLVHGWREWGDSLTRHLEGMYAFAIWDRSKTTLTLARDWYGEKPLFFRSSEVHGQRVPLSTNWVVFASDARSPLAVPIDHPPVESKRLQKVVADYLLQGYVAFDVPPSSGDVFPPATTATFHPTQSTRQSDPRSPERTVVPKPVIDTMERLLEQAVVRRLEADVPLGCFLSGGVDSSIIAAFARRRLSALKTFCVRMPDARYDESSFASAVAIHLKTDHITLDAAMSPAEDLVRLVQLIGQPFGDSSLLPAYWVSLAARAHVKVALSGDGGDEFFFGYERYLAVGHLVRWHRWLELLPAVGLLKSHPKSRRHKLGRMIAAASDVHELGLAALSTVFSLTEVAALTGEHPHRFLRCEPGRDAPKLLALHDLTTYLPFDLLRKTDVASMAAHLEVRCPFLDRDLSAAAIELSTSQLLPRGERKGLLKAIARKHLPASIVDRPKMGFAIPIGEWFRSDFGGLKTLLMDSLGAAEPFGALQLDRNAVRRYIDEHMNESRDHGQKLFALLTLSLWARSANAS